MLERLPAGPARDRLERTAARLAAMLDDVHAVCVAAQLLAPSESEEVPGAHGGVLLDVHRALARAATLAAQSGEPVMLAVAALRAQDLEEAERLADAAGRTVDQVAEHVGRARELVHGVEPS
jgi:hypothetical protein